MKRIIYTIIIICDDRTTRFESITISNYYFNHISKHTRATINFKYYCRTYTEHRPPSTLSLLLRPFMVFKILFVVIKYRNWKLNSESRTNDVIEFHLNFLFHCKNVVDFLFHCRRPPSGINFYLSFSFSRHYVLWNESITSFFFKLLFIGNEQRTLKINWLAEEEQKEKEVEIIDAWCRSLLLLCSGCWNREWSMVNK